MLGNPYMFGKRFGMKKSVPVPPDFQHSGDTRGGRAGGATSVPLPQQHAWAGGRAPVSCWIWTGINRAGPRG